MTSSGGLNRFNMTQHGAAHHRQSLQGADGFVDTATGDLDMAGYSVYNTDTVAGTGDALMLASSNTLGAPSLTITSDSVEYPGLPVVFSTADIDMQGKELLGVAVVSAEVGADLTLTADAGGSSVLVGPPDCTWRFQQGVLSSVNSYINMGNANIIAIDTLQGAAANVGPLLQDYGQTADVRIPDGLGKVVVTGALEGSGVMSGFTKYTQGSTNLPLSFLLWSAGSTSATMAGTVTAEAAISGLTADIGSFTIPAGTLTVGATFTLRYSGTWTLANGGFYPTIYLRNGSGAWSTGWNLLATIGPLNQANASALDPFDVTLTLTVKSVGVGGEIHLTSLVTAGFNSGWADTYYALSTIDTTIDTIIAISGKFAGSSGSNTLIIKHAALTCNGN